MADPIHLNARAERCSAPLLERGQRLVFYHGEESTVVGLFFARGHNGQRELCYILRLLPVDDQQAPQATPQPAPASVPQNTWLDGRRPGLTVKTGGRVT